MEEFGFQDECGVVGIWNVKEASNIAYLSLYSQQHRGQEGAGVVSLSDRFKTSFYQHKGLGLVADVFQRYDFSMLPGKAAIGHVRYTTAGGNTVQNVQPFTAEISSGLVAVAHNGNLVNADSLRKELIAQGAIFSSTSDTEIFLHLLTRTSKNQSKSESLIEALKNTKGAFSLVVLFEDRLFAVRDPNGLRPLAMGTLGGGIIFASETCAFDLVGAKYIRDVEPGEIIEISGDNAEHIKSYFPFGASKETPCIFEYVYFARPDSKVFNRDVYQIRKRFGAQLAIEHEIEADMVIPVPDSGVPAALGYSQQSKIPFELGLIRNHYVGRTFIEPQQSIRDFGVKIKLNPTVGLLEGKKIIVIDDSIVRGTTSKKIVDMLRAAGAKEVHMRISSPPTVSPCYYGIDTPSENELIASKHTNEEIAKIIGVDSIGYLSLEGMYKAVQTEKEKAEGRSVVGKFCDACFTKKYPAGKPEDFEEKQLNLFR